jgi:hypothetical protein
LKNLDKSDHEAIPEGSDNVPVEKNGLNLTHKYERIKARPENKIIT